MSMRADTRLFAFAMAASACLFVPKLTRAQGVDRARFTTTVDSIVTSAMKSGKAAAGMTIGVMRGDDTLLIKPYGFADLEFDVPTPEDAIYEIGSVTKQFTAAAILRLQEQGKLSLSDELTKYLPDYPLQGRHITIRQLLNHTSGIKGYTELPEFGSLMMRKLPKDSLVALFSRKPFDFEPGEAQIYNNSAFFLLGLIIEKVSGRSYAEFVQQGLFERAGMKSSRYCDERAVQKKRAHGYDAGPSGLMVKAYIDQTWPYAAGSLCSTARDLLSWNRALHTGKVLSPDSYRQLIAPGALNDGTRLRYGMGIVLTDLAGHRSIHHGGGIPGYVSESAYFPDDSVTIVVLINTAGPVSAEDVVSRIAEALLGRRESRAVALDRPVAEYEGTYRGAGRGVTTVVRVSHDSTGKLQLAVGTSPASTPMCIGKDTFERQGSIAQFRRERDRVVALHLDQGYGHYVLVRQP